MKPRGGTRQGEGAPQVPVRKGKVHPRLEGESTKGGSQDCNEEPAVGHPWARYMQD